jgi:alpha-beta hydrolase superfamily lysophospholipase
MVDQIADPSTEARRESYRARDGADLYVVRYPAVVPVRAAVACIHGIQSHAGWYNYSCRRLAQAGFETFFADRRGSGQNGNDRGDCAGYRQLVGDLADYVAFVRQQCPDRPVVAAAISWGGKLVLAALAGSKLPVDAAAFICPGWFAKVGPTLSEKLVIAWSYCFRPTQKVRIPLSDPWLFTNNPQWHQFLRDDPHSLREGTARLLMASRALDRVIAVAPSRVRVPCLLMLAGQDRIIDNDKTRRFFDRFAGDKRIFEYPQAHHTLEFEPNPDPIIDDLIAWLTRVTTR